LGRTRPKIRLPAHLASLKLLARQGSTARSIVDAHCSTWLPSVQPIASFHAVSRSLMEHVGCDRQSLAKSSANYRKSRSPLKKSRLASLVKCNLQLSQRSRRTVARVVQRSLLGFGHSDTPSARIDSDGLERINSDAGNLEARVSMLGDYRRCFCDSAKKCSNE
jgi:hypothetical protein